MAASGHFEFCALPRVAQTFKRGVAAYFVTNTLKYQKKASNFVTRGLVTEFMILPLLHVIHYCYDNERNCTQEQATINLIFPMNVKTLFGHSYLLHCIDVV